MKCDLTNIWYRKTWHILTILLLPLSGLFGCCVALRRFLYRIGLFKTYHTSVPVIVVGNLTVGGTGKTPFVMWLADFLKQQGYRPGIISRGVGGKKQILPHRVKHDDAATSVGDEALLLARNTDCPLVICVDRVKALRELLKTTTCNIVISDDGLQHYRLGRDMEVVMIDSERGLGNQCLLPAGPLRESASRLSTVDMVVKHGGSDRDQYTMSLIPTECVSVINPERKLPFQSFPRDMIHAVAGIGHPQRFFSSLKKAGFTIITHAFRDHHAYQPRDFDFADSLAILMTEKDAVKCAAFADERYWTVRVVAKVNDALKQEILARLSAWSQPNEYKANGVRVANDVEYGDFCG